MGRDQWAEWLAVRRFGGDPETRERFLASLIATRDRVLEHAELREGETLLDVGCGEGLIGALERGAGTVVFSDVSADLLEFCGEAAGELGVIDRCRFVTAPADDLRGVGDGSVDVVTTRSVLIYVSRKRDAFAEFARVLRPGGRISLFEPINRFALRDADTWAGYDVGGLGEIGRKLRAVYEELQPRDSDPMLDFDERDLVRLAEGAGFPDPSESRGGDRAHATACLRGLPQQLGQPEHPDARRGDGAGPRAGGARPPYRASPPSGRAGSGRVANGERLPCRDQTGREIARETQMHFVEVLVQAHRATLDRNTSGPAGAIVPIAGNRGGATLSIEG